MRVISFSKTFWSEVIIDLHAGARNNTEKAHTPFKFPLNGNTLHMILHQEYSISQPGN